MISVFCFICMNPVNLSLYILTVSFPKWLNWTTPSADDCTDASVVTLPLYSCASLFWLTGQHNRNTSIGHSEHEGTAAAGHRGSSPPAAGTAASSDKPVFTLAGSYILHSPLYSPLLLLLFIPRLLREQEIFLRIFLFSFSQLNSQVDVSYADLQTHSLNSTSVAVLKTFSIWASEHTQSPSKKDFLYLFVCFFTLPSL